MNLPLMDFVLACLIMGVGIGTDVAIATVLRAKHLKTIKMAIYWIIGVSLTHTLFPMFGYLLTYFSIQIAPLITPMVGVLAFACIARFLWQEFAELMGRTESEGDDRQLMVTLGLILAVSWDALWSGPAKSAQVIGWPELLVWLSFWVVGVMVAAFALFSLYFSNRFNWQFQSFEGRSFRAFGVWIQYSVITYFGLLALLRYTLGFNVVWWQLLLLAFGLMGFLLLSIWCKGANGKRPYRV